MSKITEVQLNHALGFIKSKGLQKEFEKFKDILSDTRQGILPTDTKSKEFKDHTDFLKRKIKKTAFVKDHEYLCMRAEAVGYNSSFAKEVVKLAREELDYSKKTVAMDLFGSIMTTYRKEFK